jgi:hypothetical protein
MQKAKVGKMAKLSGGPVGGAGELTAAVSVATKRGEGSTIALTKSTDMATIVELLAIAGCERRSWHDMQLKLWLADFNPSLAAKAPQGVPSREQFERELYASDEQLTHKAIMRVFDAALRWLPHPRLPSSPYQGQ